MSRSNGRGGGLLDRPPPRTPMLLYARRSCPRVRRLRASPGRIDPCRNEGGELLEIGGFTERGVGPGGGHGGGGMREHAAETSPSGEGFGPGNFEGAASARPR